MRKNPHGRILKGKSKEQHLSTVTKSCSHSKHTKIHFIFYKSIYPLGCMYQINFTIFSTPKKTSTNFCIPKTAYIAYYIDWIEAKESMYW